MPACESDSDGLRAYEDDPATRLPTAVLLLQVAVTGAFLWVVSATTCWPTKDVHGNDISGLPAGFASPVLAMQFLRTGDEVGNLLQPVVGYEKQAHLRSSLQRDFCFIATYVVFLGTLGFLFTHSPRVGMRWLALPAMGGAGVAGAADCLENWFSFKLLDAGDGAWESILFGLRTAASTKWSSLFVATACLAFLPYARPAIYDWYGKRAGWARCCCMAFSGLCALAALAGLAGLFISRSWIQFTSVALSTVWLFATLLPFLSVSIGHAGGRRPP